MMPHTPIALVLGTLTVASACEPDDIQPRASGALEVRPTPSLDIGHTVSDTNQELYRVTGAARLPDGRVVIANSGSSELRFFDSEGRHLRSAGRRGGGPGEFTGELTLLPYHGDSLLVWDARLRRSSLLDSRGAFVRLFPLPLGDTLTFPWDSWLYRRFWLEGVLPSQRPAVAQVVNALHATGSVPSAQLMLARLEGALLWVTTSSNRREWTAYDASGRGLGTLPLPSGFEPFQFGHDFVLGRWIDADEREHVRMYHFEPSALTHADSLPEFIDSIPVFLPGFAAELGDPRARELLNALMELIGLQEAYFVGHGQYASTSDSLSYPSPARGVLVLLAGNRRGWAGAYFLPDYALTCMIAIGASTPPGWAEGLPKCG